LLAQGDDLVADRVGFGGVVGPFGGCEEEVAVGFLSELVDQDAEGPRGVSEPSSDFGASEPLDEEGAEGFVLALGWIGGFEEHAGEVC
jgi:hypothetical protein